MTDLSDDQPERCHRTPCRLHELDTQSYANIDHRAGASNAPDAAASFTPVRGAATSSTVRR
jgi:hypothetical protein